MKNILKLEELGMFIFSVFLFTLLNYPWWLYVMLILTPDISMVGYLVNAKVGAVLYNLFHHRGLAIGIYLTGSFTSIPLLLLTGIILFGHSSLDRLLGYGLKHTDSFKHTHLGVIGESEYSTTL